MFGPCGQAFNGVRFGCHAERDQATKVSGAYRGSPGRVSLGVLYCCLLPSPHPVFCLASASTMLQRRRATRPARIPVRANSPCSEYRGQSPGGYKTLRAACRYARRQRADAWQPGRTNSFGIIGQLPIDCTTNFYAGIIVLFKTGPDARLRVVAFCHR